MKVFEMFRWKEKEKQDINNIIKEEKMKIKKETVYQVRLSGHYILLIQTMITNAKIRDSLSEQGKNMADVLYDSLECDSEEIKWKN